MQDNCFLDSIDPEPYPHSNTMSQAGIDNEDLSVNLKKRVDDGKEKTKSLFSLASICMVPEDLREQNRSAYTPRKQNRGAYTPRVIAIGPLHHYNLSKQENLSPAADPTSNHGRTDVKGPTVPFDDVKAYYTHRLLSRLTKGIEDAKKEEKIAELLQECANKVKQKEYVQKAKEYYVADLEAMDISDKKMSEMMLFDGCFIIELLYASYLKKLKNQRGDSGYPKALCSNPQPNRAEYMSKSSTSCQKKEVDPILDIKLTNRMVKQDLLLLENQIPFFVLEDLFKLTVDRILGDHVAGCTCKSSLTQYVVSYFDHVLHPEHKNGDQKATTTCSCFVRDTVVCIYNTMTCYCEKVEQGEKEQKEDQDYEPDGGYDHILHLLHQNYRLGQRGRKKPDGKSQYNELPRSASDLQDAGVKFVSGTNNSSEVKFTEPRNKIAWWFHRAKFEIPTLYIHDSTEPFLRNLIAFEQCCPEVPRFVSSYAKLMDMLINSEKDVEVLKKARVVHNYLGKDGDVSDLFNGLCKEIAIGDQFFFNDKCQKAYTYSQQCWPKCIAYWKHTYFDSPWAFRGVLVAILFFGITITNFVRSFLK